MKIKRNKLNDSKGAAMVIVIVVVVMLTLIASFVANLGYNQRRIVDVSSGQRAKKFYSAQAGVVDANFRIRENWSNGPFDFTVPTNSTTYSLDVDGDGTNETSVTIGAANAAGVRTITSTGLDV